MVRFTLIAIAIKGTAIAVEIPTATRIRTIHSQKMSQYLHMYFETHCNLNSVDPDELWGNFTIFSARSGVTNDISNHNTVWVIRP